MTTLLIHESSFSIRVEFSHDMIIVPDLAFGAAGDKATSLVSYYGREGRTPLAANSLAM